MIKSMTAYAAVEKKADQGVTVSVEIRTVNSRAIDLVLRLPNGFAVFEEKIKSLLHSRLERGRIEVRLTYVDASEKAVSYEIDAVKLKSYLACLEQLQSAANIPSPVSLDYLAGIPGMIVPADTSATIEGHWPLLEDCINEAIIQVDRMRCQEGEFIGRDITMRIDGIEKQLGRIEAAAGELPALYRDKLQARIENLTAGVVDLDPVRLAQEAALLADRSDISEEIVRVRSHFEQFRCIMADEQPAGRRLNFLLQELNREFNTMGSKAGQAQASHMIVEIKAEIEKIREQVQNIE